MSRKKTCIGFCKLRLPLSQFGKHKGNKDGRNVYCKKCCAEKMRRHRAAIKETVARKPCVIWKGDVTETAHRVLRAIRKGKRSQLEIARHARLKNDDLGEALAELILDKKMVQSVIVNGQRKYFERRAA